MTKKKKTQKKKRKYPLNPQQKDFLARYTHPHSSTFGKIKQSALAAGYSESYSINLNNQVDWVSANLGDLGSLLEAERVLKSTMGYDPKNFGDKIDNGLLRIQTDTAKFFAKTLGKEKYTERKEVSGPNGGPIMIDDQRKQEILDVIQNA